MSAGTNSSSFFQYQNFVDSIAVLDLPISGSELHGVMCGYLCAGASQQGEMYLRALVTKNKQDAMVRSAALAMFEIYTHSQHQLANGDFEFKLLLPDDHDPLVERAQAFSEWCEGFAQGMTLGGVDSNQLDEDSQEALHHIQEFAQLDYHSLEVTEDDEKSLMEVSEYTRMAVLQLSSDIQHNSGSTGTSADIAH